MKSSNLQIAKFTKEESLNAKAMFIYKKYEYNLREAKKAKEDYLFCKEKFLKGNTTEVLIQLTADFKKDALEYWEKSQLFLLEYNNFNKNR